MSRAKAGNIGTYADNMNEKFFVQREILGLWFMYLLLLSTSLSTVSANDLLITFPSSEALTA